MAVMAIPLSYGISTNPCRNGRGFDHIFQGITLLSSPPIAAAGLLGLDLVFFFTDVPFLHANNLIGREPTIAWTYGVVT